MPAVPPAADAGARADGEPAALGPGPVEVGMNLTRLVGALGPDALFQVPRSFRGEANALSVRALLSAHAAAMPGFVAEVAGPDPLRRPRFRVAAEHEQRFLGGMEHLIREILLEPRFSSAESVSITGGEAGGPDGLRTGPG